MNNNHLFPNIKRVLRNAIAVGIIATVANFKNIYPPNLELLYTLAIAFGLAFAIEFANAYKNKPQPHGHRQNMITFFLA